MKSISRRYKCPGTIRYAPLCVIALTGVVSDLLILSAFQAVTPSAVARAVAVWTFNCLLIPWITMPNQNEGGLFQGYFQFCAACCLGTAANWGVSHLLYSSLSWCAGNPAMAAEIGVAVSPPVIYAMCSCFVSWDFPDLFRRQIHQGRGRFTPFRHV